MKILVFFVGAVLFILPVYAQAQAPDILWMKDYGYGNDDEAWQLKQTPDGGFIIVGSSQENDDIYLLKTDENGDTLWSSLLGFTSDDIGRSVEPLDDGGYIITGYAGGYIVLMKTDSLGNHMWHRYLDSGWGRAIRVTSDGGFVVAGYTPVTDSANQIYIAKTDTSGVLIWSKTYGGLNNEMAWDVQEMPDSGFAVLGWTESFGGASDIYLIRTDSNGESLWSRRYGNQYNDEGRSILVTGDGGFIIAGKLAGPSGGQAIAVINVDADGGTVWTKTYSGGGIIANSICSTSDGCYILTGMGFYIGPIYSSCIIKIDSNGDSLWTKMLIDSTENLYLRSIVQTSDCGYVAAGYHQVPNHANDVFLIKLAPDITGIENEIALLPSKIALHQNYPNPFNASTSISFMLSERQNIVISIYDLLGRKISVLADDYFDAGIHNVIIDAGDLTSGIYFYSMKAGDLRETKKMILLK